MNLRASVKIVSFLLILILVSLWLLTNLSTSTGLSRSWTVLTDSLKKQIPTQVACDSTRPCDCLLNYLSKRNKWKDYQARAFQINFRIASQEACHSRQEREAFPRPKNPDLYWQEIYKYMTELDQTHLAPIYDKFRNLAESQKLTYLELPAFIMSYIQSIPYILVHPGSCEEYDRLGGFAVDYHRGGGLCLPYQKYGLQTPLEFMYHQIGDCDTRVIFAYSILSYFGYDVVILGSPRHAMIGINLSGHGNFILHKGKKYYFWETTYANWMIGAVPPEYQYETWEVQLESLRNF